MNIVEICVVVLTALFALFFLSVVIWTICAVIREAVITYKSRKAVRKSYFADFERRLTNLEDKLREVENNDKKKRSR